MAEKDYLQADINFQAGDVWKILVGGAKLSRGFTVEGLTISYYTRRTIAADTLMQMGRWFGYRPRYRDLVRLYIGRNVPAPRNEVIDLYKSFEAIVRDEEDFRDELRKFQGFEEDGRPRVRPMDVPPLVYQSLPYLKPTSTNKMYNAELTEQGEGGKVVDFNQQGEHDDAVNKKHFGAVETLLDAATTVGDFFYINPNQAIPDRGALATGSWTPLVSSTSSASSAGQTTSRSRPTSRSCTRPSPRARSRTGQSSFLRSTRCLREQSRAARSGSCAVSGARIAHGSSPAPRPGSAMRCWRSRAASMLTPSTQTVMSPPRSSSRSTRT